MARVHQRTSTSERCYTGRDFEPVILDDAARRVYRFPQSMLPDTRVTYYSLDRPADALIASFAKDVQHWVEGPPCSANPSHRNRRRVSKMTLEVKHNRRDEKLIASIFPERLIHASLADEFASHELTGYRLRPATVRFRDGQVSEDYSELIVTGWAGVARPESGIHLIESCKGCGYKKYSPLKKADQLIDWSQWTEDDFFILWPLPAWILITQRVVDLLEKLKVKSYTLGSLKERPNSIGFSVGRLSEHMPEDLAQKYGRPLGLEP